MSEPLYDLKGERVAIGTTGGQHYVGELSEYCKDTCGDYIVMKNAISKGSIKN